APRSSPSSWRAAPLSIHASMDRGWILSRRSYASPSSWNRPTSWRAAARPSHPSCDSPLIFRARENASIAPGMFPSFRKMWPRNSHAASYSGFSWIAASSSRNAPWRSPRSNARRAARIVFSNRSTLGRNRPAVSGGSVTPIPPTPGAGGRSPAISSPTRGRVGGRGLDRMRRAPPGTVRAAEGRRLSPSTHPRSGRPARSLVRTEGLREQGFRGIRIAEAQEGVAEPEDRAGLRWVHIEDRLEQDHGFVRMAVPAELLRLQDDVTRLGRIDAQGLLQRVDGLRKPIEAEQQVRPFEPGPPIPAVHVDHPLVGFEGLLLAAEQDQE